MCPALPVGLYEIYIGLRIMRLELISTTAQVKLSHGPTLRVATPPTPTRNPTNQCLAPGLAFGLGGGAAFDFDFALVGRWVESVQLLEETLAPSEQLSTTGPQPQELWK